MFGKVLNAGPALGCLYQFIHIRENFYRVDLLTMKQFHFCSKLTKGTSGLTIRESQNLRDLD